jgi:hypothetical protein
MSAPRRFRGLRHERVEGVCRLRQSLARQGFCDLARSLRRILAVAAKLVKSGKRLFPVVVHEAQQESVGMLGDEPKGRENGSRKIAQVCRDDKLRFAMDGGGKDVTILSVRQREGLDAMLISLDW